MNKARVNGIIFIILFSFAGILVFWNCHKSMQASMAQTRQLHFIGEYRVDGSQWEPLKEDTQIDAFEGDVQLRGRFDSEVSVELLVSSYLDHIGMTVEKDGEIIFESSSEVAPEMCGRIWNFWIVPALADEDEICISLHNPHHYGNPDAYNEFLDSFYPGGEIILRNYLQKYSLPYLAAGVFIIVMAIALLGTAIGYLQLKLPGSGQLLQLGIMSVFVGIYFFLDTIDSFFRIRQITFNTYMCQLSVMLAAWILSFIQAGLMSGRRRKIAEAAVYALAGGNMILMVLSFAGIQGIYDAGRYWALLQGLAGVLLIGMSGMELKTKPQKERIGPISGMILLSVGMLELANAYVGWWWSGICFKLLYIVMFLFHLVWVVRNIVGNYEAAIRAQHLKEELRNSRTVLAMSQIRTHFVFNVLNAISGMCEYDPQKADETLVTFSRYLRNNINIMEKDEPEPFTKSLKHLEEYIQLEQIRFGKKKIQFIKEIEIDQFLIPPLVLQPIVENAIKYGLRPKKDGGTIQLHTWTDGQNNIITIGDDGTGYDSEAESKKSSVGLKNVRFRMQYMVNGTMEIRSRQGEGTTVTLTIPCMEEKTAGRKEDESHLCG